ETRDLATRVEASFGVLGPGDHVAPCRQRVCARGRVARAVGHRQRIARELFAAAGFVDIERGHREAREAMRTDDGVCTGKGARSVLERSDLTMIDHRDLEAGAPAPEPQRGAAEVLRAMLHPRELARG